MLNLRLYRKGLIVVVLGVIVFAFSLQGPPAPLAPNLAPDAYSAGAVTSLLRSLDARFGHRSPGSPADLSLAASIGGSMAADGFAVTRQRLDATGATGAGTYDNVIGTRPGISQQTIAIVAPRYCRGGPAAAQLSASAVLVELAQVLGNQSSRDTVLLASTSAGGAGARALARLLAARPVDAVIVLGDLVRAHPTQPILVPWSDGPAVAPPALRRTLAAAIARQSALRASAPGLASQLAHGALPVDVSGQGTFGARGMPAVLLSTAGERGPTPGEAIAPGQAGALGAAVLESVDALAAGPPLPAPSSYLTIDGQSVPAWAVALLVATLILPVLVAAIDGAARARRRRTDLRRALMLTLAFALPALLCLVTVRALALSGAINAPPEPPGAAHVSPAAIALLALMGVELLGGLAWLGGRAAARRAGGADGPALLLVASVLAAVIWSRNPLAALLLVPALHLWPWLADDRPGLSRPARAALALLPLAAPGLLLAYYARADGFSAPQLAWSLVLMLAAGRISLGLAILWSVALGCLAGAGALALRARRAATEPAISIRGPLGYAGPGSLGGTESALRR